MHEPGSLPGILEGTNLRTKRAVSNERDLATFVERVLSDTKAGPPFRRIVAAFAGDEQSDAVLSWTVAIAKVGDGLVRIVRAYGELPATVFFPAAASAETISEREMGRQKRSAAFDAEFARQQIGQAGLQASVRVADGAPVDVLHREAQKSRADLIVVGGSRKPLLVRFAEGSVASGLAARSRMPILLARSAFRCAHMLIAVDGSLESEGAVRTGFLLARAWGALVTVLHVDPTDISWPLERQPHRVQVGDGPPLAYVVLGGVPAEQVAEYAEDHDVDLIVTGARAHRSFLDLFRPSVSRRIARKTEASVLLLRPTTQKEG